MLLTPLQELNAVFVGRFTGLAWAAEQSSDPEYFVRKFVELANEYQKRDAELLAALRHNDGTGK